MNTAALAKEAQRQRALLAALTSPHPDTLALPVRESATRAARGLGAYRANAHALAERALGAAFPTVQAMLGGDNFPHLAREFWQAEPPQRGDIGEWGEALPAWLAAHTGLAEWPWLADCARLDLALHRCERAEDASLDAASLALLQSEDPQTLQLVLLPGTALIVSRWPLATIHAAHQGGDDSAFETVRAALAAQQGETVLVVRQGWRATVQRLDEAEARWVGALLAGLDLSRALQQAGDDFDFAAWLSRALAGAWLKGAALSPD